MIPQTARPAQDGVHYAVWAPRCHKVHAAIMDRQQALLRSIPLSDKDDGIFKGVDHLGKAGDLYKFALDATELVPDMGSHFQPQGVHGPSEVIAHDEFIWPETERSFVRPDLQDLVIYECHIGSFTREGTFHAAQAHLPHLQQLGVTAIQLMPVADFAGQRNWGYDGVALYAPSRSYGRPKELKAFVSAAHAHGLAVILDVVYNHFGPDGNYIEAGAPEFFSKENNVWGRNIDFRQPKVRDFILANVLHWMNHYHIDGFRLDATHAMFDPSHPHILAEISNTVRSQGGFTIAEDERNCAGMIDKMKIDALWADDFHHALKMMLLPEPFAHFKSYQGSSEELVDTIENGWLFRGRVYKQTGKNRGTESRHLSPERFIYCISNHDQVGNRPLGERLNHLISPQAYAAASALLCVLPYTPMLFMGQEFAASTPFCFFTDHAGELGRNVSKGRLHEFKHYGADFSEQTLRQMPDPQDESTFLRSKLDWNDLDRPDARRCLEIYRQFLTFRRERLTADLRCRNAWSVQCHGEALALNYGRALMVFVDLKGIEQNPAGWRQILASAASGPRTVILERK